ncbi:MULTISPECIES: DUF6745 domain-containing protein [Oscillatoriales]|uniref:DUF6745 domain-containing protein n=1 Tax=Oscillatoriophycideae TaxID=1301283 RepID=UPI001F550D3D|nr:MULTISPECIES: hypothetical protein [Oscillatoriales]
MVKKLTPEQEYLISVYQEKWERIALSIKPIDRIKATIALENAYRLIRNKKPKPKIIFFDSPFAALSYIASFIGEQLKNTTTEEFDSSFWSSSLAIRDNSELNLWEKLETKLWALYWKDPYNTQAEKVSWRSYLWQQLKEQIGDELCEELEILLVEQTERRVWEQVEEHLVRKMIEYMGSKLKKIFQANIDLEVEVPLYSLEDAADRMLSGLIHNHFYHGAMRLWNLNSWNSRAAFVDFCFSALNCDGDREKWLLFQSLVKECNWVFPLENLFLVCDRPRILSFDNQQRLHAEGSAAIQYADGFSIYAYHGIILPEEYGKVHPDRWQAEWLLSEKNAELRRVLIQGIGYARICQELQPVELDNWQEYTLLKIDNDVDIEQIYMLKMTCPSTGYIHALRVPPNMRSAREAIKWVNWGIDPQEFSIQT